MEKKAWIARIQLYILCKGLFYLSVTYELLNCCFSCILCAVTGVQNQRWSLTMEHQHRLSPLVEKTNAVVETSVGKSIIEHRRICRIKIMEQSNPMKGMVDSFNVSVAAGIVMHRAVCDRITLLYLLLKSHQRNYKPAYDLQWGICCLHNRAVLTWRALALTGKDRMRKRI
ncbi:uncharacterized protein LOC111287160 isoform X3 [Durio zibethinus]|uniref:Uncharacterized protein LOC111287160 isoform X3 n=1 Tax=Durio zibethinus TaxID=66656 RepID=A0A6P5XYG9_DURZI|nr:uncharacterized protein LOC111287160 isoform X3 [Durio zibethinus]